MKTLTTFVLVSLTFSVEVIKGQESEFSEEWIAIAACRAKCLHKVCSLFLTEKQYSQVFSETRKEN